MVQINVWCHTDVTDQIKSSLKHKDLHTIFFKTLISWYIDNKKKCFLSTKSAY